MEKKHDDEMEEACGFDDFDRSEESLSPKSQIKRDQARSLAITFEKEGTPEIEELDESEPQKPRMKRNKRRSLKNSSKKKETSSAIKMEQPEEHLSQKSRAKRDKRRMLVQPFKALVLNDWPADTLERPTLSSVMDAIPSKTEPPTWGNVSHHILQCVLAMVERYQSSKNTSFDRVASKLIHIENVMLKVVAADNDGAAAEDDPDEDLDAEKDEEEEEEEDEDHRERNFATGDEEPRMVKFSDVVPGLVRVRGPEQRSKTNGVKRYVVRKKRGIMTDVAGKQEVVVSDVVSKMFYKVAKTEQSLRNQVAERFIARLRQQATVKPGESLLEVNVGPNLADLKALLAEAAEVYLLANKDVTREGLDHYLRWVELGEKPMYHC